MPAQQRSVRTEGALVHGAQSSYFIIAARTPGATAGIHFRAGGGAALLGVPAHELTDQHLGLCDLWGAYGRLLREQLLECSSPSRIFQTLETALLARLRARAAPLVHPAISFALRSFAVPAGSSREMVSEYFASFRMGLLLDSLRSRYPDRYIFLDSPPALGGPDAKILAGLCDVVVLVAGYGHDTPAQIAQAASNFDPAKFAGVVFNEGL